MNLNAETSLDALLKTCYYLADFLVANARATELLGNRLMRGAVGRMATLKKVAALGEVKMEIIIPALNAEIAQRGYVEGI